MKIRYALILLSVGFAPLLFSCKNNNQAKNHGPIVLGDSSTIVTEKDPKKLMDLVVDLQPDIQPVAATDTAAKTNTAQAAPTKETPKNNDNSQGASQQLPDVAGLKAEFKDVAILIPNITAKLSGNPNLKNANGAVYTLINGNLDGNTIRLKGNVNKVMQKCQSVVILKNKLGSLPLDNLTGTSDWEQLKPGKNGFGITGLDEESLAYPKVNNSTIRNAVSRAATKRRMNHKKAQEWLSTVASVHSANQKPLTVALRSVIWKIDGKDEKGKAFSKQIRIDLPI